MELFETYETIRNFFILVIGAYGAIKAIDGLYDLYKNIQLKMQCTKNLKSVKKN